MDLNGRGFKTVCVKQAASTRPWSVCAWMCVYVCVCVVEKELDQISSFLFGAGHKFHSMKGNIIDSTSISLPRGWWVTCLLPTQTGGWHGPEEGHWHGPWLLGESTTQVAPCLSLSPWTLSVLEFHPFSTLGRTHVVPPGPAVWVWLNNYKLPAADLSFMFRNMPVCVFCGHASPSSSHSRYCHWEHSGSMFVLGSGSWRSNVAPPCAAGANVITELHNKSFLYLLSPPRWHWNCLIWAYDWRLPFSTSDSGWLHILRARTSRPVVCLNAQRGAGCWLHGGGRGMGLRLTAPSHKASTESHLSNLFS